MEREFSKVLVVSTNAWRENTGSHTLISLFKVWDSKKLAQVYTRSALPDTTVCDRFFQISENLVLKSIFNRKIKTGKEINAAYIPNKEDVSAEKSEAKLYRRNNSLILRMAREFVWKLGGWKTKELENFLRAYDPEVLFLPVYPTIYMGWIQKHILKKTKRPAVCYLTDDNYTYKVCGGNPVKYIHRFFLRKIVRQIVADCDKMFVIAPKQKEEYDKIFGVESVVLTKGIDFSESRYIEKPLHTPIRMVYTGKLMIGRWRSLAAIGKAVEKINREGVKITLDIYTADRITKKQQTALTANGLRIAGAVSLKEVVEIQGKSDVLVFVESLDKRHKNAARLSFSTKLTDYLKSGKCIFAVGDRNIAPIEYLEREDAAIVAGSYDEIGVKLQEIFNAQGRIIAYGKKAFECGKRNHDVNRINSILMETINATWSGDAG